MPYTIYIPRPYQSRTHIIPPLWTTSASSIAISTASPLAKAIYNDAITWGWHTEVTEQDPQEWRIYVKFARRQGWFEDLFRIWQREHGHRILARDKHLQPSAPTTAQTIFRDLREFASWLKRRTLWPKRTDWEDRERKYAKGKTDRPLGGLRRRVSEGDVGSVARVSVMSLPDSLVEKLGKCEGERRRSGGRFDNVVVEDGEVRREQQGETEA